MRRREKHTQIKYVDSCKTFEILLQDSGLAPKPTEDWNTFEPKDGDIVHVDETDSDYKFLEGVWKILLVEENNVNKETIEEPIEPIEETEEEITEALE